MKDCRNKIRAHSVQTQRTANLQQGRTGQDEQRHWERKGDVVIAEITQISLNKKKTNRLFHRTT